MPSDIAGKHIRTPTIFVIDDDEAVRKSVRWLIESVSMRVETFASAQSFLDYYEPHMPGCVLVDVRMPGLTGPALQERLRELGYIIPVVIMTGHGDVPTAVRAMKNGAVDFLQKPCNDQELLNILNVCVAKDRRIRRARQALDITLAKYETLTSREKEVMALVADGKSNKAMALELEISPKTVETHRASVMEKMAANSVAELTKLAMVCC